MKIKKYKKLPALLSAGALILLIALGGWLRLNKINQTNFFFDEAVHTQAAWNFYQQGKIPYLGPAFKDFHGAKAYLPPFYYWLITPGLLLARGNPIGIAIEIALFGILGLSFLYLFARELFGRAAGIIAVFFSSLNLVVILAERHIWNPNFLVCFASLFYLVFWRALTKQKKYLPFSFFLLGLMISLHASSILLLPISFVLIIIFWKKLNFRSFRETVLLGAASVSALAIPFLPWLAWEIKHDWQNSHVIWRSFLSDEAPKRQLNDGLHYAFDRFLSMANNLLDHHLISNSQLELIFFSLLILIILLIFWHKKRAEWIFCLTILILFILGTSKFSYTIWDYFWTNLIPLIFVALAGLISQIIQLSTKRSWRIASLILISWLALEYANLNYQGYQNLIHQRLRRSQETRLIAENITLDDMIQTMKWIKKETGTQDCQIKIKGPIFYPGFRDKNSYDYLTVWQKIKNSPDAKLTYWILQPYNLTIHPTEFQFYRHLKERQFGYLKVIKLEKK